MLLEKLELLHDIPGYMGAGVYTPEGKMLAGVTEIEGINFEIASLLFHDTFLIVDNRSQESGFGKTDLLQINTEKGIVLIKCYRESLTHFHLVLVVKRSGNIAMARLMLDKAAEMIKEEFIGPST